MFDNLMTEVSKVSLKLSVAVCTFRAEGMARLCGSLPVIEGVEYVVSWQAHEERPVPPALAMRDDVTVVRCDTPGLSSNRNNAVAHCHAPVVLIADDDLVFDAEGLRRLPAVFDATPTLAVAMVVVSRPGGPRYPEGECRLGRRLPKGYWVSSVEIAFRREAVGDIRFDTRLGLGAESLLCGEDELFVLTARRRGLDCRFYPIHVADHPAVSTGAGRMSEGVIAAQGVIMALEYGRVCCAPRLVLKAWRLWRSGRASLTTAVGGLWRGLLASRRFKVDKKRP